MRQLGLILGSKPHLFGAIKLDEYVEAEAPAVPSHLDVPSYDWGMLGNDTIGDCVQASMYHADEAFYLRRGIAPYPYQTPECVQLYSEITGYVPGDPSTDRGTDPSQAMAYWRDHGLPGHKIVGFGSLPAGSPNIRRAIWEFGAVILAVALPTGAQSQGVHWRGNNLGPAGSWGGHAIVAVGYTPGLLRFISWGEEGDMGQQFEAAYLEQVFVPLSTETLNKAGVGPAGFNFARMRADLPSPQ